MRALRFLGVIGWIACTSAGCVSPAPTSETYIVQPRDTLYSIAWRHDVDYRDLARWNHIGPDYRIRVGQVLVLEPSGSSTSNGTPPRGAAARSSRSPDRASQLDPRGPAASEPQARTPEPLAPGVASPGAIESSPSGAGGVGQPCSPASGEAGSTQGQRWMWPTAHASPPRPVPGGGILLLGEVGQPIHAACPGRVVYAGNGIRGYGNLIIIKHGATVLSAYAHTIDLAVHEGQDVSAGESIARMGSGSHRVAALYFEIRLNGRPVDPLPYLPRERD
jgi:lipoprotein NlpD